MYRGKIQRDDETLAIEVEMPTPGGFILRAPIGGHWRTIGLLPQDGKDVLLKLITLLSD